MEKKHGHFRMFCPSFEKKHLSSECEATPSAVYHAELLDVTGDGGQLGTVQPVPWSHT